MTDGTYDSTSDFNERYRIVGEPAIRRAELRVIGSDYGATSYTTRAQADRLARLLELAPGKVLLDIGSGAGWPGIYLARSTGCRIVLTDLPLEGLRGASHRMRDEGVTGGVVAASGDFLPLRDSMFDAATSSDVLC
jgi:cyclopropane fatty-acyl-phospholipid synthase-like methyltransferase